MRSACPVAARFRAPFPRSSRELHHNRGDRHDYIWFCFSNYRHSRQNRVLLEYWGHRPSHWVDPGALGSDWARSRRTATLLVAVQSPAELTVMSDESRIIQARSLALEDVHPAFADQRHGGAVRDYVHVDDVASAFLRALATCCPGVSAIYTVGAAAASVTGVVAAAEQVIGRSTRVTRSLPPPRRQWSSLITGGSGPTSRGLELPMATVTVRDRPWPQSGAHFRRYGRQPRHQHGRPGPRQNGRSERASGDLRHSRRRRSARGKPVQHLVLLESFRAITSPTAHRSASLDRTAA